jgi:hypothetical protein
MGDADKVARGAANTMIRSTTRLCLALGALACAGLGLGGINARADIIVDSIDDQQIPDPTDDYTFHCFLTKNTQIKAGSYCTIYDIPGLSPYNGIIAVPDASWSPSIQLTGITPPGLASPPPDSPTLYNLTYTYNGTAPIIVPPSQSELDLGDFGLTLANTNPVPPFYYFSSWSFDPSIGQFVGTSGTARVNFLASAAPEPSAWVLLALGIPFAGLALGRARSGSSDGEQKSKKSFRPRGVTASGNSFPYVR